MAVQFSNQPKPNNLQAMQVRKGMPAKLIKWGIAKDEKQANLILTVLAVLFFLASLVVWFL